MKILLRILKWFLISVFSIVLIISIFNFLPFTMSKVDKVNRFVKTEKYPLIIPHGGAKELAPENTVYSYDYLVNDLNAGVLEIDLSLTKDNILISQHNLDLEMSPDSDMNGALVRNYTYQEIVTEIIEDDYYLAREFRLPEDLGGTKPFENLPSDHEDIVRMIPAKIEDIFATVGNDVLYILEIKDSPGSQHYDDEIHDYELAAQTLIDLVRTYELEEYVVLASFDDDVIDYFKTNIPEVSVNAGTSEVTMFAVFSAFHIDFFWNVKSEVLILPEPGSMTIDSAGTVGLLNMLPGIFRDNIATKDGDVYRPNFMHSQIINDAHRHNMAVLYWTVDDPDQMRLLIELGADGIITDRPDLLKAIIDEMMAND